MVDNKVMSPVLLFSKQFPRTVSGVFLTPSNVVLFTYFPTPQKASHVLGLFHSQVQPWGKKKNVHVENPIITGSDFCWNFSSLTSLQSSLRRAASEAPTHVCGRESAGVCTCGQMRVCVSVSRKAHRARGCLYVLERVRERVARK